MMSSDEASGDTAKGNAQMCFNKPSARRTGRGNVLDQSSLLPAGDTLPASAGLEFRSAGSRVFHTLAALVAFLTFSSPPEHRCQSNF